MEPNRASSGASHLESISIGVRASKARSASRPGVGPGSETGKNSLAFYLYNGRELGFMSHIVSERRGLLLCGPYGRLLASQIGTLGVPLENLLVSVAPSTGMRLDFEAEILALLTRENVKVIEPDHLFSEARDVVAVGWRRLIDLDSLSGDLFVAHDSLLPRLRGWNPLVSALELGLTESGFTLFRASGNVDDGPIVLQRKVSLARGIKVEDAITFTGESLVSMLRDFYASDSLDDNVVGNGHGVASLSVWRDDDDYKIDWSKDADSVCRFVASRGWPYLGAVTYSKSEKIRVLDCSESFAYPGPEIPGPGKVIGFESGAPIVLCGAGMLKLTGLADDNYVPVTVNNLRTRFS